MKKGHRFRTSSSREYLEIRKMKHVEEVGKGSGAGAAQEKVPGRGQKWPGQRWFKGAKLEDRGTRQETIHLIPKPWTQLPDRRQQTGFDRARVRIQDAL